jgi:hypothetical protein
VHKLRIALPYVAIVLGVITIGAGIFAITEGASAKSDVESKLDDQSITLPEDAGEIVPGAEPGAVVDTPDEAEQMANVINAHALEATGGLTYAEMGRFATEDEDPAGTDDPEEAATARTASRSRTRHATPPSRPPPCRRACTAPSWGSGSPTSSRASGCSPSPSGSS